MRVEYINPFVESAITVLREMASVEFARGDLALRSYPLLTKGVVIVIGVAGQIEGRVLYDMDMKTALKISGLMMGGEIITEYDEMVASALAELGNIISGNAVSQLNDLGFEFDITPPTLFVGNNLEMSSPNMETQTLVIPLLQPEVGEIIINVALREKN
ncbi:MAG: chemotaxis protein CheX [Candidatus Muirbacterium halophilum]|nr:chemotaxis protein CheX [Candidatus Muirbacterium halophilum]MCK9476201.1 chemotaxis protein CheX [Candidatus Muirbacterium halophilum]